MTLPASGYSRNKAALLGDTPNSPPREPFATVALPLEKGTIDLPRPNGKTLPLDNPKNRWISAALAQRTGTNPDAVQIADATIALWYDLATALKSVIGRQGVNALYDRSVTLTARTHPWLVPQRLNDDNSVNLDALQSVIARQTPTNAAAGSSELLQTFYDVLLSLIGPALCEQLLSSIREDIDSRRSGDSLSL